MFPDLVEWFEEPFLTLRPYLAQPIRIEDFVEGDHYLVRCLPSVLSCRSARMVR